MPSNLQRDASFIVRIWWERRVGPESVWRGQVVHAQTRQAAYFNDVSVLINFIYRWTGAPQAGEEANG
jgi:isocitrate dehydrogenase kinase/phosphatase